MKAHELDKIFDDGKEDIIEHFDLSSVRRPNRRANTITINVSDAALETLDKEAKKRGVTLQEMAELLVTERLE